MKISTKGRYALRLMLDLACNDKGGAIALRDVSARQGISVKYLEQIVGPLCKAGLLKSVRGAAGGYRLTRAPEGYPLGEVLRVTEGELVPVACLEPGASPCERVEDCPTLPFWQGLQEAIGRYVDSVTLKDLMQ
ncbi:MAG: Rrf2 family transcriptional regulator [Oscillospiraceae bacterium]|nr:Rrf2 family transcriptional regulator [Oscillospiraceae bacterium]